MVRHAGFPAFEMLCGLLESAVRHSRGRGECSDREDYSSGWRPAIEDNEQNLPARDLLPMLAEALRDAAEQLTETAPDSIPRVVHELEHRNFLVFGRIALHLLRVRPGGPPDLAKDRLIRKDLFDSSSHRHEYTLLLEERFAGMVPPDQEAILGWIDAGPDLERSAVNHEFFTGQRPSAEELGALG